MRFASDPCFDSGVVGPVYHGNGEKVLTSFEINGFRTFSHLRIERLGLVNLVTGKNNVGKSTLLEGVRLFAQGGPLYGLWDILRAREELAIESPDDDEHLVFESLFHGRTINGGGGRQFSLGPVEPADQKLTVAIAKLREIHEASSESLASFSRYEPAAATDDPSNLVAGLVISGSDGRRVLPLSDLDRRYGRRRLRRDAGLELAFISAAGADAVDVARWWNAISLTDSYERIVNCMKALAPVERIAPAEHRSPRRNESESIFRVRLAGSRSPIPLKALGDGAQRMFQVATAIEYAGLNGQDAPFSELETTRPPDRRFLFIDEAESGIHYTALAQFWQFIFRTAKARGTQVFATTHSWDCIEAFQKAAAADPDCDPMLIRIELMDGRSRAVLYDKSELPIVVRENVEVR